MSKQPILVEIRIWDMWKVQNRIYLILEYVGIPSEDKLSNLILIEGELY